MNYLEDENELTLNKYGDDARLEVAHTSEDCTAIQGDLRDLERWQNTGTGCLKRYGASTETLKPQLNMALHYLH
ncbi:hypothetical protein WISP_81834 [Willisornis vidua]|uniref:Uncharacterized protein n=1 Tax=Willisornis vidua TaxID=1566151 RepID=A0ABQ9D4Q9_9PASS|nr:hypothetical protein WISP_81834 [Willisornis vidua]